MKVKEELTEIFKPAKIKKNDVLLIHSNLEKIIRYFKKNKYKFKPEDIINFLLDKVGINGTIIFPTFNFGFCKNGFYSFNDTKSEMGILSEIARKMNIGQKTWHPVYSTKIFGKIPQNEIDKKNYSGLGSDSIFNWINEVEGKIIIINLTDQQSMTIYHHYEELKKVDWRVYKNFCGKYQNSKNIIEKISVKLFVRNLKKKIITDVNGMEKILWEKNLYNSNKKYDTTGVRSIETKKLKKEVFKIIDKKLAKNILFKISKI